MSQTPIGNNKGKQWLTTKRRTTVYKSEHTIFTPQNLPNQLVITDLQEGFWSYLGYRTVHRVDWLECVQE